jgi:GGDEF domain-containing protein
VLALLVRWLSQALSEFEQSVLAMSLGTYGERRARQGEIYREIRRARLHQRPLAILALVYDAGGPEADRVAREAEAAMRRHYLAARVARAARGVLDDYQIMAKQDDHFVIVLPETGPEAVAAITDRVRQAIRAEVGVTVRIGAAFMPEDAATFEGLVEQAVSATNGAPGLAAQGGAASPLPAPDAVRQPGSAHGIPHTQ